MRNVLILLVLTAAAVGTVGAGNMSERQQYIDEMNVNRFFLHPQLWGARMPGERLFFGDLS